MKNEEREMIARLREMGKEKTKPLDPFEALGEMLGASICLVVILAVPVLLVAACVKYLFL